MIVTKQDIRVLKRDLKEMEFRLIMKLRTIMTASIASIVGLVKLL